MQSNNKTTFTPPTVELIDWPDMLTPDGEEEKEYSGLLEEEE